MGQGERIIQVPSELKLGRGLEAECHGALLKFSLYQFLMQKNYLQQSNGVFERFLIFEEVVFKCRNAQSVKKPRNGHISEDFNFLVFII